jgi:hypothetical protein
MIIAQLARDSPSPKLVSMLKGYEKALSLYSEVLGDALQPSKLTVSVEQEGGTENGVTPMKVTFMKGSEPLHSLAVSVGNPAKYGSKAGLNMAAAMKVQEGSYDLSEEMHTALAEAVGTWGELRRLEVEGEI